ncbi:dTDP-4-dehydrorhamnose reductase [Saccharospirillum sp.]|uniref:dTDP-4-dehydrorhamnose reductase n=1 Tax=Saccharospirillum sp. TaxID=2033801 RepID=UPI0034A0332D
MSILILGTTGQVGHELTRQLKPGRPVLTPTRAELDLTNLNAVSTYLEANKPTLIINAAAYTAVDNAESEPTNARQLNTDLPERLAQYSQQNNQWLVHYSTDYVYSGEGTEPWQEADPANPVNQYGKTKLAGDRAVQQGCSQHLILRTSWVYSTRGHNFLTTMLRLARERTELGIVNDQHGAPTPAAFIAKTTLELLGKQAPAGLYHLAPAGETTWFGFARALFDRVPPAPQLIPIPTNQYPTQAKRPLNSRLNLAKIEQVLGKPMPHWEDLLQHTLKDR